MFNMSVLKKTSIIMDELLASIELAQIEILLQIYYVDDDEVFARFTEKLIEKSMHGVKIYCLFDALGANSINGSDTEKRLRANGINIQYFNWLTPWTSGNKRFWYFRNHKRSLIIDKNILHTGGWCIGNKTKNWIEADIKHTNIQIVSDSVKDFWNMYKYAKKPRLKLTGQKRYTYFDMSYTYQTPLFNSRYIYYTHKKLIQQSENKIVLLSPYFVPIRGLLSKIKEARKRGVIVELYICKKTDQILVDLVAKTYIHKLLKIGVDIYFSETMIHAKVCMFDNIAYIGTMNLDTVSLRYNFENGIYINDINVIQEIESDLASIRTQSKKTTLEAWNQRSIFAKILDKFMRLFRPFV